MFFLNICMYLYISPFWILVGDQSQLRPLKTIGRKTVITESLFDLAISQSMKTFTIKGQFRASNSYERFLGNYLYDFHPCLIDNTFIVLLLFQNLSIISLYNQNSFLASFRMGFPRNKQIHRLNQNALVSLSNDYITEEKVKRNIFANPHTIFLAPSNSTVDIINNFVINVLFRDQRPLMIITNGLQNHMPIHRHMTLVITENRYSLCTLYFVTVIIYK